MCSAERESIILEMIVMALFEKETKNCKKLFLK